MAYAEKYYFQFYDSKDNLIRVGILKSGYVGSSTLISARKKAVQIKWQSSDIMTPIKSSIATLNLFSDTNFKYQEFYTAAETDYYCQIKENGSLFWEGLYVPENYSEQYIDTPYPVTLRFSDLGYLKKAEFTEAQMNELGEISSLTKLINYLQAGPLGLSAYKNIVEVVNVFESQMVNTAQGFLYNIEINLKTFRYYDKDLNADRGKSWFEILQSAVSSFGSTFYQWNNKWYFWRIKESLKNTPTYYEYTGGGDGAATSTGTIAVNLTITNVDTGNPNELVWMYKSPAMEITDKYSVIKTEYKWMAIVNIPGQNIYWDTYNAAIASGLTEVAAHEAAAIAEANASAVAGLERRNMQMLPYFGQITQDTGDAERRNRSAYWLENAALDAVNDNWGYFVNWHYNNTTLRKLLIRDANIETVFTGTKSIEALETPTSTVVRKNVITKTTDKLVLEFNYRGYIKHTPTQFSGYSSDRQRFIFCFRIQVGSYYLTQGLDGSLSWSLTANNIFIQTTNEGGNNGSVNADFWFYKYEIEPYRLEIPTLPENGVRDFKFIMFAPVVPDAQWYGIFVPTEKIVHEIQLRLFYLPDGNIVSDIVTKINTIATGLNKTKTIKLFFSDGVTLFDRNAIRIRGVNAVSANWYEADDTYTLQDHATIFHLKPLEKLYNVYRNKISGVLKSNVLNLYNVLNETGKSYDRGLKFIINSMTVDMENNEHEVELEEIQDTAIVGAITQAPAAQGAIAVATRTDIGQVEDPNHTHGSQTSPFIGITEAHASIARINALLTDHQDNIDYPL